MRYDRGVVEFIVMFAICVIMLFIVGAMWGNMFCNDSTIIMIFSGLFFSLPLVCRVAIPLYGKKQRRRNKVFWLINVAAARKPVHQNRLHEASAPSLDTLIE